MIGSAGDFGANMDTRSGSGGEDNHTVLSDESDVHQHRPSGSGGALEDWRPLHTLQMGSNDSGDGRQAVSSLPKMFTSARKVKKGNQPSSFSSEGIESFSSEMKRFEYIKRIIHAASTPQEYRECLLDQALDNGITIPVAYMKVGFCSSLLCSVIFCSSSTINHRQTPYYVPQSSTSSTSTHYCYHCYHY